MAPDWLENLGRGILPFTIPPFGLLEFLVLPIPLLFLRWRRKSAGYLLSFSLFFLYAWALVSYTILYMLPANVAELEMIQRSRWSASIHLVPSFLSGGFDPRSEQVYGNFLLGVPFGFGLPFVARTTHRRVALLGFALAAGIELAQLLIGLLVCQGPYRVIDVDDVWLVFAGTLVGYGLLWTLARVYQRLGWIRGARVAVWEHFHTVLLRVAQAGTTPPDLTE